MQTLKFSYQFSGRRIQADSYIAPFAQRVDSFESYGRGYIVNQRTTFGEEAYINLVIYSLDIIV
jgi:hypothetical protein